MLGYGSRRTHMAERYRRTAGHAVRKICYDAGAPGTARTLARIEIRQQLAAYRQDREYEARAEAHASTILVTRLVQTAACKCGCIKIYKFRAMTP